MKKPLKVYVVGYAKGYASFLDNYTLVNKMEDAEVIVFTGGADISPALYGESVHPTTYYTESRDKYEVEAYYESLNYPHAIKVGICRGAQLFTALNGGKLVQDVTNHAIGGGHKMTTIEGEEFKTSSLHHQMCYPYDLNKEDYDILGWSSNNISDHYYGSGINWQPHFKEIEILYFPKTNCLGVQGHPEMMAHDSGLVRYVNKLINAKLDKNVQNFKKCHYWK